MRKQITLFLFISLLFWSCDDYLERAPGANLDENKVFQNFESATQFHADIYTNLAKGFNVLGDDTRAPLACATDEADSRYGWHTSNSFNDGAYENVDNVMANCYAGIRKANLFLSKKDIIPFPDKVTKERMMGEAFFLRAFFFHEVIKRYGGMPIMSDKMLKPTDNLNVPRNSYMECVDAILSDLADAIRYLPVRYTDNHQGRATQGAAMALKSRVLLYAASPIWDRQNNRTDKWEVAYKAAYDLLELKDEDGNKAYELYGSSADDYESVFLLRPEEGNSEVIFWRNDVPMDFKKQEIDQWAPEGEGFGGKGAVAPTQNFVNLYEMSNGMPIDVNGSGYDKQNPYKDRDPRFYKTIIYNGSVWQGVTAELFVGGKHRSKKENNKTGYYVRKYLPESVTEKSSSTSYHNWIYFRLAEIYLNYAEALNESLGAPNTEVYNAVNTVRRRSEMPELPAGLSKNQMRERIKNERAVELSFEEHRWWDVRRWEDGNKYFNGAFYEMEIVKNNDGTFSYNEVPFETRIFMEKMNLYPIPKKELDKNPLYKQNPGWNS